MKKKFTTADKILLLVELSTTVCQCIDILTYVATTDVVERKDYYIIYTAIVNRMKEL